MQKMKQFNEEISYVLGAMEYSPFTVTQIYS